ncbi:MAG: Ig-like domain-containing protein, partial [Acidobacteriota bacterium]
VDGVNVGAEDRSGPFTGTWDSTTLANGTHTITALARDNAGNAATSAAVTVTVANSGTPPVDTTAPTVSVTAPTTGATVTGTATVTASAFDNVGVSGVQFKLDGANLGAEDTTAPYSVSWNSVSSTNGAHTLAAIARDAAGNATTSADVTVTVSNVTTPPADTTKPVVSVSAPSIAATVTGPTTVSAAASDNVGVTGVQFKLDGINLGAEDTTGPYSLTWDTTTATNGSHALTALARDAAGNTALSSPVTVTVSNTTAPPAPTTIVLHAANVPAGNLFGNWIRSNDNTAADGIALWNIDNGIAKIAPAPVAPQHYVDITFNAQANTAYHLWIRMRAQNDYFGNDSIHVQFSDSVNAANAPIYRIGSSGTDNSAQVVLQERDGGLISGWGWADQGWNGNGPEIYFASSGQHTLRIGQREDGTIVDQIVLSSDVYLTTPPGAQNHDNTILPATSTPPPGPGDTTAPTVAISAPTGGSTVWATVTVSATSADDTGVVGVQFKLDGANLGAEDTTAPYSVSWNANAAGDGPHTLTAQARDAAGNTAVSSAVTVTVVPPPDTAAPTVSVTSPSGGTTVSGTKTVTATAADNVGVAGVQFKLDGADLGAEDTTAPYSVSWNTTTTPNGTHTLTAEARDAAGNTKLSAGVTVTVSNTVTPPPDTTAPSVALTAPAASSTVSGAKTVTATASDNIGVAGVQFRLDGVNLGAEDTSAPYSVSWNTSTASNGAHTLTAEARDAAGNTTLSAPVTVTVSNSTTTPPATIVLRASDVLPQSIFGNWVKITDNTAADGVAIWNPDNGIGKIVPAPVAPQHYVEITFTAQANTPYHLWVRMRAQNDYFGNDSIHVQFSDSVDAANAPIYRIGSTGTENSAQVVLQEVDAGLISGWGWADQGWNGLGPNIYFATSGPHTVRIQQREDGTIIDQIVLSSGPYLTAPPGPQNHDNTIVPR